LSPALQDEGSFFVGTTNICTGEGLHDVGTGLTSFSESDFVYHGHDRGHFLAALPAFDLGTETTCHPRRVDRVEPLGAIQPAAGGDVALPFRPRRRAALYRPIPVGASPVEPARRLRQGAGCEPNTDASRALPTTRPRKASALSAVTTEAAETRSAASILRARPGSRFHPRKRKPPLCGGFRGGRYWARTSDPQLVETKQTFARVRSCSVIAANQRLPFRAVRSCSE
jgi:hypothetical protein